MHSKLDYIQIILGEREPHIYYHKIYIKFSELQRKYGFAFIFTNCCTNILLKAALRHDGINKKLDFG